MGKKGPRMATTSPQKKYRPSNQVDRRPKEDRGNSLDSKGSGPDGVVSNSEGLCPAVGFERLMDRWMDICGIQRGSKERKIQN